LSLPTGTELKGRYVAGRVLGDPGGFGITYLGFDRLQEERVAIKEYMPRELAGRDTNGRSVVPHSGKGDEEFEYGKDQFLGEARTQAQFDHANIAGVRDFFETNGTAYLVMDYYEGKTLKQYLSEQPEGRMDPENATEVMLRVLDGLQEVHVEGYLHRDVKPSNIYLTREGRPILIDFGAARQAIGERSRSLSVVMTEGYAPYEQYRREGNQGPWTDVYGCGATLYRMVTGKKPPSAADRIVEDTLEAPSEVNVEVPEGLGQVVEKALAPGNKERHKTAEAFQERLQGSLKESFGEPSETTSAERGETGPDIVSRPGEEDSPESTDEESKSSEEAKSSGKKKRRTAHPRRRRRGSSKWTAIAAGLVVAASVLGVAAMVLYPAGEEGEEQVTKPTASDGQSSSPTGGNAGSSDESTAPSDDSPKTDQLLEKARSHLQTGRLTEPEGASALSAVQVTLEREPGSEEAQRLLDQIAGRLAEKGDSAQEEGELSAAVDFYRRSLQVQERPDVREKLETVESRIDEQAQHVQLIIEARSVLRGSSPSPSELKEAASKLQKVLDLDPSDGQARGLLEQVADRLAAKGEKAKNEGNLEAAASLYERSLRVEERPDVRGKLETVESRIDKRARRDQLITEARSVLEKSSPSARKLEAAASKLEEALELGASDSQVRKLLEEIADQIAARGKEAERGGDLETAGSLYERSLQILGQQSVQDKLDQVRKKQEANKSTQPEGEEEQEIFMVVENQPELKGGMKALQESVEYPEFAKKAGIEGRVIVQFVVNEQGNVQNPKVTRGVHKLLNKEAIKAVKEQSFKPGKQRGEAVKVQMSLPVTFRLQ